ncbi:MAG: phosphoribosylanthranilate isomerase [Deltaproteobacteria bacterium]
MTRAADATMAVAAGADMIGLNFSPSSRRFVSTERALVVAAAVPSPVWKVGVFVNSSRAEVEEIRHRVGLDALQFHGDEPAEMLAGWPCPVIRAFRIASAADASAALDSSSPAYYLLEGDAGADYGGVGAGFKWAWAREIPASRLIVAGGLKPENVADAVRSLRPFGVDVASGVESEPGIKDAAATAEFIQNAKST